MSELRVGGDPGLLFQNQDYSTSTKQTLFHAADAASSDAETFSFGGLHDGGFGLSQTAASDFAGSQTGFYTSTATSDLIMPSRIGMGFMGTVIADPFGTESFIGSGLVFPQMVSISDMLPPDVAFTPTLKNDMNVSAQGSVSGDAAEAIGNATVKNDTAKQPTAAHPAVIKPNNPLYHQQNKPFSSALSWSFSPTRALRSNVQNMTGFDRFLMNTVGKSTTDKAFNGTTSSPVYITPDKALAPIVPYQFISDAMQMTRPGTQLMNRAWPL